jgi:hypothetical protein
LCCLLAAPVAGHPAAAVTKNAELRAVLVAPPAAGHPGAAVGDPGCRRHSWTWARRPLTLFGARDVPEGLRDVSADGWHAERDVARAALLRKGLTLRDVATQLEVDPRTVERWVAKGHLFEAAEEDIGVLVYSGAWLAEDAGLLAILRDRARTASACGCYSATRRVRR